MKDINKQTTNDILGQQKEIKIQNIYATLLLIINYLFPVFGCSLGESCLLNMLHFLGQERVFFFHTKCIC